MAVSNTHRLAVRSERSARGGGQTNDDLDIPICLWDQATHRSSPFLRRRQRPQPGL